MAFFDSNEQMHFGRHSEMQGSRSRQKMTRRDWSCLVMHIYMGVQRV
jgi:hypothetical protein